MSGDTMPGDTMTGASTSGDATGTESGDSATEETDTLGDSGLEPVDCNEAVHQDLASGQWHEIPNTAFSEVCACENGFPQVCGASNCGGPFAFSGATFDPIRNRMVLWGGGHNDYYGNELYAFDLTTFKWSRLNDPSTPAGEMSCTETLSDGRPASRHTYGGIGHMPSSDEMFSIGGSLACLAGDGSVASWRYRFGDQTWSRIEDPNWVGFSGDPMEEIFGYSTFGTASAWDEQRELLFIETTFAFTSYHPVTNTWTMHTNLADAVGGRWESHNGVVATESRQFLSIGGGEVFVYDLDEPGSYETWETSGPQAVVDADAPGLAYDPASMAVVGWANGGLYVLDLKSRAWASLNAEVPGGASNGVWGRFAYVPCEDAFVAITDEPNRNVYVYKK